MTRLDGELFIDSSIGRNTHFSFGYSLDEGIEVTLTSPSGQVFDKESTEYSDDGLFGWVRINIQANAEVGHEEEFDSVISDDIKCDEYWRIGK